MDRAKSFRDRYGDWALILSRPIPVLAEASVFLAGASRAPFRRVFLLTTLANVGISIVYSATGAYANGRESFLFAFAGAIALPGITMSVFRKRLR
jgi:membrane protein DedA with SNARE-associated domain